MNGMEDHNSCDIRIEDLTDQLTAARAAVRGLSEALENYQSFPIVAKALTTHAAAIQDAKGDKERK